MLSSHIWLDDHVTTMWLSRIIISLDDKNDGYYYYCASSRGRHKLDGGCPVGRPWHWLYWSCFLVRSKEKWRGRRERKNGANERWTKLLVSFLHYSFFYLPLFFGALYTRIDWLLIKRNVDSLGLVLWDPCISGYVIRPSSFSFFEWNIWQKFESSHAHTLSSLFSTPFTQLTPNPFNSSKDSTTRMPRYYS